MLLLIKRAIIRRSWVGSDGVEAFSEALILTTNGGDGYWEAAYAEFNVAMLLLA